MPSPAEATHVVVLGAGVSCPAVAGAGPDGLEGPHAVGARPHGGRIRTVRGNAWPVPAELQAEFVQGRVAALLGLARQAGLPVVELRMEA